MTSNVTSVESVKAKFLDEWTSETILSGKEISESLPPMEIGPFFAEPNIPELEEVSTPLGEIEKSFCKYCKAEIKDTCLVLKDGTVFCRGDCFDRWAYVDDEEEYEEKKEYEDDRNIIFETPEGKHVCNLIPEKSFLEAEEKIKEFQQEIKSLKEELKSFEEAMDEGEQKKAIEELTKIHLDEISGLDNKILDLFKERSVLDASYCTAQEKIKALETENEKLRSQKIESATDDGFWILNLRYENYIDEIKRLESENERLRLEAKTFQEIVVEKDKNAVDYVAAIRITMQKTEELAKEKIYSQVLKENLEKILREKVEIAEELRKLKLSKNKIKSQVKSLMLEVED